MFAKILVCLDGSGLAEQIVPYAMEAATHFGSKVVLLQVISTVSSTIASSIPGVEPVPIPTEEIRREENEAEAYLERVARSLREKGLDVECVTVLAAQPGEAIVRYANSSDVDLLAIATHGRSGLRRLVVGSVGGFVLRNSGLPMLVIRPKEGKTPPNR